MKDRKMLIFSCAAAFVLFVLIFLFSCKHQSMEETDPTVTDPISQYNAAAEQLRSEDRLSYYIAINQSVNYDGQIFNQHSQQRLNIQDPYKDTMKIFLNEALDFGNSSVSLKEYYENGNGYVTIDENTFSTSVTPEEFIKRYTPASLFTPSLYSQVKAVPFGSRTMIYFNNPNSAEQWALPSDATFTDASGYALLDQEGNLQESVYTISYSIGSSSFCKSIKTINAGKFKNPSPSFDNSVPIDCFDAPRMLERACSYLLQAKDIHSVENTNIHCQTFSINRSQSSALTMSGFGPDFNARLDTTIDQVNQSRGGETTNIHQTEIFKNGLYSISENGSIATENTDIDAAEMKAYCQEILVRNILLPKHIFGASIEESEVAFNLTFLASHDLAEAICSNICNMLYSDPALLHALSSDYSTQSVECTLSIDKYTGLPLSFTSRYSAHHTIEEISYQLESQTNQTYEYTKTSGQ